jgi:hypothetical protein
VSYEGLAGEEGSCVSMKISCESHRFVVGSSLRHEVKLTSRSCSGRQCRSASLALRHTRQHDTWRTADPNGLDSWQSRPVPTRVRRYEFGPQPKSVCPGRTSTER